MKIFTAGKKQPLRRDPIHGSAPARTPKSSRIAGNVFFALFAAVAMVGAVGYGLNTVMRGPISTMSEVTRRTVAESTVVTTSRLAIVGATTQQSDADCDGDTMVEPLPFRTPGAGMPAPVGGGYLPTDLTPDPLDPWNTEYGYCAWDSGTAVLQPACGTNRLAGAPDNRQYSIAIISAGKDKKFQTSCIAYDGASPNAKLLVQTPGSDDIVLGYTYAEANDLGSGMWKPDPADNTTAQTRNALEGQAATFGDGVNLKGNILTGGGLLLPGDNGDDLTSGPCNSANDKQIRRNLSTSPPTLEICDLEHGLGWTSLSGTSGNGGAGGGMTGTLVSNWKFDELSGTIITDSVGPNNGTLTDGTRDTFDPVDGSALIFNGTDGSVEIPNSGSLQPTALTISAWVKPADWQDGYAKLLTKEWDNHSPPTYNTYGLVLLTGGEVIFETGHNYGVNHLNSSQRLKIGQWNHIVATYDPAASERNARLYINGVLDVTDDHTEALFYDTSNTGNLFFGMNAGGTERVAAAADDIRLYNYAIDADAVAQLYQTTRNQTLKNETPARKGRVLSWGRSNSGTLGNDVSLGDFPFPGAVVNGNDFIQVSMGANNGCGVKAGGRVWCWGSDGYGQLGNGPVMTGNAVVPELVQELEDVAKVATGGLHSCALKRDGTVWCWGSGAYGKLGNGDTADQHLPVQVSNVVDFVDIEAGFFNSCGIRHNGEAWCWGRGNTGQLGNGTTSDSNIPVQVSTITNWAKLTVNGIQGQVCGITKDGTAYCWGEGTNGKLGNGGTGQQNTPVAVLKDTGSGSWRDWIDIDSELHNTCGVRRTGQAYCWGVDADGQIGNGSATSTYNRPVAVSTYSDFKKIAVGSGSICGLRVNGEVACWGDDGSGELGNGPDITGDQASPVMTPLKNIIDIAAGLDAFLAISDTNVRPVIKEPVGTGKITNLDNAACAIKSDGTAWCWGQDTVGQLGNGPVLTASRTQPSMVTDTGPWVRLGIGGQGNENVNCGIKNDGTAWCWGDDTGGGLGNGSGITGAQSSPTKVTNDGPWSTISSGVDGACALKTDGTAWCWGPVSGTANYDPVQVGNDYKWNKIVRINGGFCGITTTGVAMCQGWGGSGRLGNGQTVAAYLPLAPVAEAGPWIDITTHYMHTCGIKADGTAWCWGLADNGRLGNNQTSGNYNTPQMVVDMGPWAYVSPGVTSTCGIKTDGTLWCWGDGTNGMLGNGLTSGNVPYPVQIVGGGQWISVINGPVTNCGMKADESVWCWGSDSNGQLGNGVSTGNKSIPDRVLTLPDPDPWTVSEDNGGVNLRSGVGVGVGTARRISGTGAAGNGMLFATAGRTSMASSLGVHNMTIESGGDAYPAQLSFKAASVTAAPTVVMSGLSHHWKLDETSGTSVMDSATSNPVHGTYNGTSISSVAGMMGTAIDFPSLTDVETGDIDMPSGASMTISMWINNDVGDMGWGDGWREMVGKGGGGNNNYYVQIAPNDSFVFGMEQPTNTWHEYTSTTPQIVQGTWQHLTVAHTFGNASSTKMWVNGQPIAGSWGSSDGTVVPLNDVVMHIANAFSGSLDDIRMYSRILSDAEVLLLYNSGGPGAVAPLVRAMGLNPATGNFTIGSKATNTDAWLDTTTTDLEINNQGDVGIGTNGMPQAKLDVNGAIKVGNDSGSCTAGKAGAIRWTGSAWHYCKDNVWNVFSAANARSWDVRPSKDATGLNHSCYISADSSLWCWGDSDNAKLGDNQSTTDRTQPVKVHTNSAATGWSDWVSVATGWNHTCGIRINGTAWCWGAPWDGALGDNQDSTIRPRPVQVQSSSSTTGWTDWVQIGAGENYTCGLRANGTAWCWGNNSDGRAGNGVAWGGYNVRPVQVLTDTGPGAWSDWKFLAVGTKHSCGIRANGTAWCWGLASDGQLGDGQTSANRAYPVRVHDDTTSAGWSDWIFLSAGWHNTCGIRSNGTAWCWGADSYGALGAGGIGDRSRPIQVQTDTGPGGWSDWTMITPGVENGTCGIRANGTAWCWGLNDYGVGGYNGTGTDNRPRQVHSSSSSTGWTDWTSISRGTTYACGVRSNGTAWCWGAPWDGQLGDGQTSVNRLRPVQVQ